jgi:hypothetical protein
VVTSGVTLTLPGAFVYKSAVASIQLALEPAASRVQGDSTLVDVAVTGDSPTGNVEIKEGSAVLGVQALDSQGMAHFNLSLTAGDHELVAHYVGDSLHDEVTSDSVSVHLDKPPGHGGGSGGASGSGGCSMAATSSASGPTVLFGFFLVAVMRRRRVRSAASR